MTKRDLVKIAINYTIAGAVESAAETTLECNTDIVVEDNLFARVGCAVAGVYIASRTKPLVSNGVDKIANSWLARKEQKAIQKLEDLKAAAA